MSITLLAALDKNGAIGKDNTLPWHSVEDLIHFKEYTSGPRKVLVMGRKTYDSLPGKKLSSRFKIVLSSYSTLKDSDNTMFINNKEDLFSFLGSISSITDEVIVIGGESIYTQFLSFANKLVLTIFDFEVEGADRFFPMFMEGEFQFHSSKPLAPNAIIHTYKKFS